MKKFLNCFSTACLLCLYVNVSNAQAPALGSAANFVLFTTTGALGNTGITGITGDIGTNNGAITGFGNINGNMHSADGATFQCAADLLLAYNQLNNTVPTLFPGILLGNGSTLTPGVYQTPSATTISGELTLDALGDANAVFIFQIQGPLSTSFASKVKLINGALACNVFWKVEGVVSMASATYFSGTLIANNAAINMSPNDTLEGRALSTTGAINVDAIHAYLPTGCGSPVLSGPAAPTMTAIACYAIFSGSGAVSNAGVSYASGDIGTNVGLTEGFDPLLVNGSVHLIPDVSTAAAAADLVNVYTYLNNLPNDIELLFPAQFGNNLVLTPHTYHMGAACTFTGTVYLDARGNPDAVFVIKVNGAFSTSTFSKVVLMNGAQAQHVYWNIDGAVSIADYSVFNGTMIANNGAIMLTTGDTVNGRVLTTTGALSTASVVVTSPVICFPLPVSWLYFNGEQSGENVLLEWATATEVNHHHFTIEKSVDGVNFETLTTVAVDGHTGSKEEAYTYTDIQAAHINFYRISQTDADGKREIYKTIRVIKSVTAELSVSHYIQNDQILIRTQGMMPGSGFITMYSIEGKRVSGQSVEFLTADAVYKIAVPVQKGLYLIQMKNDHQTLYNGRVLVN